MMTVKTKPTSNHTGLKFVTSNANTSSTAVKINFTPSPTKKLWTTFLFALAPAWRNAMTYEFRPIIGLGRFLQVLPALFCKHCKSFPPQSSNEAVRNSTSFCTGHLRKCRKGSSACQCSNRTWNWIVAPERPRTVESSSLAKISCAVGRCPGHCVWTVPRGRVPDRGRAIEADIVRKGIP